MNLIKTAIFFAVFSFFLFPVSAVGMIDPPSYFEVLPNKTYSEKVCFVYSDNTNISGEIILTNNAGLIEEFTYDEFEPKQMPSSYGKFVECTNLHIKIADYKTSNEELIVEKLVYSKKYGSMTLGMAHDITFDASEVSYVNALLKFSGRLVLTIFSIFLMLTVLLYMIRKIRKE